MKKILVVVLVLVAVTMSATARTRSYSRNSHSTPATAKTPVMAYTLAGCPDCAAFKQYLQSSGVKLATSYTRDRNVSLYPTVVYSDGSTDNGERVYGRQVRLPHTLKLVEAD